MIHFYNLFLFIQNSDHSLKKMTENYSDRAVFRVRNHPRTTRGWKIFLPTKPGDCKSPVPVPIPPAAPTSRRVSPCLSVTKLQWSPHYSNGWRHKGLLTWSAPLRRSPPPHYTHPHTSHSNRREGGGGGGPFHFCMAAHSGSRREDLLPALTTYCKSE